MTHESPEPNRDRLGLCDRRNDLFECALEELVLFGRAYGDADRRGRAEAVERPDDHALTQQRLEQNPCFAARLRIDEVRDRRPRPLETGRFEDLDDLTAL